LKTNRQYLNFFADVQYYWFAGIPTSCEASIWREGTANNFASKASRQHVHCVSLCSFCIPYSQQT